MQLILALVLVATIFAGISTSTATPSTPETQVIENPRKLYLSWRTCGYTSLDPIQLTGIYYETDEPFEGETLDVRFTGDVKKSFSPEDKIIIASFYRHFRKKREVVPICKMNPPIFKHECPPSVGSFDTTLKLTMPKFPKGDGRYSYEFRADIPNLPFEVHPRIFCFEIIVDTQRGATPGYTLMRQYLIDDVTKHTTTKPKHRGLLHQASFYVMIPIYLLSLFHSLSWFKAFALSCYFVPLLSLLYISHYYHRILKAKKGSILWKRWRQADHTAIFVCIAGTYLSLYLTLLREHRWAFELGIYFVGSCMVGVAKTLLMLDPPKKSINILFYVLPFATLSLPWFRAELLESMNNVLIIDQIPVGYFVSGTIACFAAGVTVYGLERPNPSDSFGFHEVYHVFSILGSLLFSIPLIATNCAF